MKDSFDYVLHNIVDKYKGNIDVELKTISIGRSFTRNHMK